jgi:UDP-3-O-[3-hydroxymyristoyl] glucosamine N-acyltransferase
VADVQGSEESCGGGGPQALTAASIAAAVGGTLTGDETASVTGVAPLEQAQSHHVSFLASAKYASLLASANVGVLLVTPALAETPGRARARVIVANPYEAMLSLLCELYPSAKYSPGIHPSAVVGCGATLGEDVFIGPFVVVGAGARIGARVQLHPHVVVGEGVVIGDDCELHEGVTCYPGTSLAERVRVHAGVRLGSDGFGYVFRGGVHEKIPHVGRCIVESDVEIGANSTIDRGSIGDTVIGAGTKIDNLVHIAHNVRIGRLCVVVAQVGISGSVQVEDGVVIAGQAGVAGHVTIGKGARLAAQAGAFGDIPAGETWSGYPARPHREALRAQAALFKLPSLLRALERLVSNGREDAGSG